ncbi:transcriptional regulator [Microvirga sp. KLBC 81]|uniref:transcriptional regulator n=1 Tax=Microvirga sp. KLBC 81 TaxID=1862707 RepID=UPI00352D1BA5
MAKAGSEAKLGELCGVSQNAIWHAKKSGRVSAELAKAIHEATGGEVPKWSLRPDLWDPPPNPRSSPLAGGGAASAEPAGAGA